MSDNFKIGDRVRSTQDGVKHLEFEDTRVGTVVGLSPDPDCVKVKMDGLKTPVLYHKTFWERISDRKQDAGVPVAHQA